jgi:hypothetical protein
MVCIIGATAPRVGTSAGLSGRALYWRGPGFEPGTLEPGTTYYWRVDEILLDGSQKTGPVWSFTTWAPGGGLKGEYFNNPDLTGTPVLVRIDPGVNFAWGTAGPGQPLLPKIRQYLPRPLLFLTGRFRIRLRQWESGCRSDERPVCVPSVSSSRSCSCSKSPLHRDLRDSSTPLCPSPP